jgi:hypothetical protein
LQPGVHQRPDAKHRLGRRRDVWGERFFVREHELVVERGQVVVGEQRELVGGIVRWILVVE